MNLSLFWTPRMNVGSLLLYGVSMSFTASRRQSCHLSRNASAAGFPSGQSEFLRPGSLLWPPHPEGPAYSNSETTSYICRQLFDSCCCFGLHHFLLVQSLSHHVCLQAMSNTGTNFLSSIYDAKVA